MTKLVRDYVEIPEHASIDDMIAILQALRATLPEGSDAELRMRGDEVFGRHLAIAFLRPQTDEETACEARYAHVASRVVDLQAEIAAQALRRAAALAA